MISMGICIEGFVWKAYRGRVFDTKRFETPAVSFYPTSPAFCTQLCNCRIIFHTNAQHTIALVFSTLAKSDFQYPRLSCEKKTISKEQ